jgi:endonuclease/exonuclease/phosphatase family metal-dependent hydrolase
MGRRQQVMILILAAALLILLVAIGAPLITHRALEDYSDAQGPRYTGAYAPPGRNFNGRLRVVTWNLFYGERLEQAIQTIKDAPELRDADVLLLQEIDAAGVETLAERLGYNYLFYPAILDHHRRVEYGDAILSKWPLSQPTKTILPVFLPGWLEGRISASANLSIGDKEITVYSTHLDITWMIFQRGETQAQALRKAAGATGRFTIIGGDFNTWNLPSIRNLERQMGKIGLERLSEGAGYTFEWNGLKLTLDHIFSETGLDVRSGVYRQTEASDHFPVWAEIKF